MRYKTTAELPQSVKDDLGTGSALALYLDVYNREYAKSQNDVSAGVLAMDAVKSKFARKSKGVWQRRGLNVAQAVKPSCGDKCGGKCGDCTKLNTLAPIDVEAADITPTRTRTWVDSAYRGSWVRDGEPLDITDSMLTDFVDAFRAGVLGTDPPVDINHLSMSGLPNNALDTRAVGFIKDLKLATANTPVAARKDGTIDYEQRMHLYSLVEWTEEGWQLVSTRKFRYISPAFDTNHEDQRTGENVGPLLLGIAVTNTPFLPGLAPIMASRTKPAAQNLLAAQQGATMQELVDLVKSLSLGFDALVAKFTTAGIVKARELAAMCLLMAQGKVPPDAANAPVSSADLEAIGATNWAGELKAAGQDSVTIESVPDTEMATATAALKAEPAKAAEPPQPDAAASAAPAPAAAAAAATPDPAVTPPATPTSHTVEEKSKKTTIEFTIEGDKPETVTLTREQLSAQTIELRAARAEILESKIAALGAANKDGYILPPVVVDMTRALLTRKSDSAILLAKDVTVPDVNGAILRLLSEIRDRGMVLLTDRTNVQSQSGLKGKRIELLGYGPDDVPEERLSYYKRRDGAAVSGRDVCIAELMSRYISGEEKMDSAAAKRKAEREVAAIES
jgi:cation transport regulator ChaB